MINSISIARAIAQVDAIALKNGCRIEAGGDRRLYIAPRMTEAQRVYAAAHDQGITKLVRIEQSVKRSTGEELLGFHPNLLTE